MNFILRAARDRLSPRSPEQIRLDGIAAGIDASLAKRRAARKARSEAAKRGHVTRRERGA